MVCGRKSSVNLQKIAYIIKPKRTLEELGYVTKHLEGVNWREKWRLRGQRPLRFSSSHLYTFKSDVKDKN